MDELIQGTLSLRSALGKRAKSAVLAVFLVTVIRSWKSE